MSVSLAGSLAAMLALTCLVLIPVGPPRIGATAMSHPDSKALRDARWTRSLLQWEIVRGLCVLCCIALAGAFGLPLLGLFGVFLPSIAARARASALREEAARAAIVLLQMSLGALRSGAGLPEALRRAIGSADELAAAPFARALKEFDLGAPLDVALRTARGHVRDRRVILALDALSLGVGEQLPWARCAALVESAVDRLVFEQRMRDDARARTAGLRVQIVLLAVLVPGLALYLALTVPGLTHTFASPLGRYVLLPLAGILEIAGILASRRIVNELQWP